jgi:hypothetical protein
VSSSFAFFARPGKARADARFDRDRALDASTWASAERTFDEPDFDDFDEPDFDDFDDFDFEDFDEPDFEDFDEPDFEDFDEPVSEDAV